MKQFKPFDKILYRNLKGTWFPDLYACSTTSGFHFMIGQRNIVQDKDIISYEGNEHLVGTCDEPEEEITLAVGELVILSESIVSLKEGRGTVLYYKGIIRGNIATTNGFSYTYCIPMSKYDLKNLEETRKWILTVENEKLIKVNK